MPFAAWFGCHLHSFGYWELITIYTLTGLWQLITDGLLVLPPFETKTSSKLNSDFICQRGANHPAWLAGVKWSWFWLSWECWWSHDAFMGKLCCWCDKQDTEGLWRPLDSSLTVHQLFIIRWPTSVVDYRLNWVEHIQICISVRPKKLFWRSYFKEVLLYGLHWTSSWILQLWTFVSCMNVFIDVNSVNIWHITEVPPSG